MFFGEINVTSQVGTIHVDAAREVDGLAFGIETRAPFVVFCTNRVAQRLRFTPPALFVHLTAEQIHVGLTGDRVFFGPCRSLTRGCKHNLVLVLPCECRRKLIGGCVQDDQGLYDVTALWFFDHDGRQICVFNSLFRKLGIAARLLIFCVVLNGLVEGFLVAQGISVDQKNGVVLLAILQADGLVVPLRGCCRIMEESERLSRLKGTVSFEGDICLDFGIQGNILTRGFKVAAAFEGAVGFGSHVALGQSSKDSQKRENNSGAEAGHV